LENDSLVVRIGIPLISKNMEKEGLSLSIFAFCSWNELGPVRMLSERITLPKLILAGLDEVKSKPLLERSLICWLLFCIDCEL